MGQGGVPVLGGRGAGRRLCAAGPARHGPRSRRLPWGVCAQDPGTLAAKARWMGEGEPEVPGGGGVGGKPERLHWGAARGWRRGEGWAARPRAALAAPLRC